MKCPACSHELTELTAGAVTVDVCRGGCGGIWFDHQELKNVDEQHEDTGDLLMGIERASIQQAMDCQARRHYPRCADTVMMRHFCSALLDRC